MSSDSRGELSWAGFWVGWSDQNPNIGILTNKEIGNVTSRWGYPQDPCLPSMVTFTINIPPMLACIPYMDPMGYELLPFFASNPEMQMQQD